MKTFNSLDAQQGMAAANDLLAFGLDYPAPDLPLYSNVNFANGYCFSRTGPVDRIKLYLNGRHQDEAIVGYPRLDLSERYRSHGDHALYCGFQCYFDSATIVRGNNRFDFEIDIGGKTTRLTRVFHQAETGKLKISDVFIDIVGPCNLRCAMCPQGELEGTRGERGRGVMAVELFDRVLAHLRSSGYGAGQSINLYNWGDPLIHPELGRILDLCYEQGYRAIVSTNLSFPASRVRALTEHPVELLLVSISGFSRETYGCNHAGGDFELVRSNLERLRSSRGAIETIVLKYLVYRYNQDEIAKARAFANEAGFAFGTYQGAIPSAESFFRYQSDTNYQQVTDTYIAPETLTLCPAHFCPQEATVTINHRAELDRCCVSWGSDARVSVFDADFRQYLERKTAGAFCRRCLASGYAYYKHFGIIRPELFQTT